MNPLAALTFNDTLGTKDHAVIIRLGEGLKDGLDLLNCKLLGSFLAERGEYLVGMVMMVVMVVTAAAAVLVMIVVVMLVVVVVTATLAMLIVIVVVMLVVMVTVTAALAMLIVVVVMLVIVVTVAATLTVLVVVVMVVLVVVVTMASALTVLVVVVMVMLVVMVLVATALAMLVVVVMVMLVVVVTVATALTVLVVIVVMMVVMVVLFLKSLYRILNGVLMLHSKENVLTVKEIPGSCHDNSLSVMLTKETNALGNLLILCGLGMGEDDGGSMLDLVVIELAKVLHIHLALINVGNGGEAVKSCTVLLGSLCRADNVRELTNARGLDDDSIGIILLKNLNKRLGKIANKRAAETAGVHLSNLDTCIGKESAVNTDLTELVLNENNLLTCICLFNQLLDKRGFTCAKEAGKYINLCHCKFTSEQYFYK